MSNGNAPVLVGVAQLQQRVEDPTEGSEPLEMMIRACELAGDDTGAPRILQTADSVCVIKGIWHYDDPGRAVATRIGSPDARSLGTPFGGNMVQSAISEACLAIQSGERDVAVITGAENGQTLARMQKQGAWPSYSPAPGVPDAVLGNMEPMNHPAEIALRIVQPIQVYPIFENAIRHARGESLEAHSTRISELWGRFSRVAVDNPHAWIREPFSAETIRTPSANNRMIGFPYTKLMNSNNAVDMAAALILCSQSKAEALGIDPSRFVFPHAATDAHDHYLASHRVDLHSSPAIRIAGKRAMELAETCVDEIDHVDVYSCFPSAVQVAADELGLDLSRQLTVTGGLTFGGGPINNYVMHSVATMAEVLRGDPGSKGLVTANGGYLTKHAFGIYSTEPPSGEFRHEDVQKEVDALPSRDVAESYSGPATIESYTVMYDGDGPAIGHAALLLEDGRRTWANTADRTLAEAMTRSEFCGRPARVVGEGELRAD
jgi:acetyl-CoA C-acetyltransferase